jgi:hypothetical protein
MFKTAVLGPIGGFGVARQCVECQWAKTQGREFQCFGFGPGCLGAKPMSLARDVPRTSLETSRKAAKGR